MTYKGLFCSKPFQWLEVGTYPERGSSYLCCPSWLPMTIGNLSSQSADEVWNGPVAQFIRKSILAEAFAFCTEHCPHLCTVTGPVQRKDEIEDPKLRQIIENHETHLPFGPEILNAAFDRSCNLSCPTCRTRRIIESESSDEILALQNKIEDSLLKDVTMLYITGSGDAFGSPYFNRWLRNLKRNMISDSAHIHIHTNAQLWTPDMWNKIPEANRGLIKSCEISIDAATDETYAINRRGGSFAVLLENLDFVRQLKRTGPLEQIRFHMVVQANNFREMAAFVELGKKYAADCIYFSHVVNWNTYSADQYSLVAVHIPDHPQHRELLQVLSDPLLKDPVVDLGNLTPLVQNF